MRGAALLAAASALLATGASAQPDPRTGAVLGALTGEAAADSRYSIAFSDLNDDHRQEALVHLMGSEHCGSGGCTTFVLTETDAGWTQIGRMTVSRLPIYRLPDNHNGWFDLGVYVSGGGVRPGVRVVRFERGKYGSNPTKGAPLGRVPQQATLVLPVTSEALPFAAR